MGQKREKTNNLKDNYNHKIIILNNKKMKHNTKIKAKDKKINNL